jgi:hypothetical protein
MSCQCASPEACTCQRSVRVYDRLAHLQCHMVAHDRASAFHCDAVGRSQSMTPEGFLICHDVPIARTGEYLYGPGETPLQVGADGVVHVHRSPEEVFHPKAIASFEGKDVVNNHPRDENGVTPDNWRNLAAGHVQNVHRGEGVNDDYLFADLVIKDSAAIKAVKAGKKEVSAGYDAEYRSTGTGQGEQYNIRGNHVALVESGRCGPRCSIKDHQGVETMTEKVTFKDRLMAVFGAKDEKELQAHLDKPFTADEELGGSEGSSQHPHVEVHNHFSPSSSKQDDPPMKTDEDPAAAGGEEKGAAASDPNARLDRLEQAVARIIAILQPDEAGEGGETDESNENPEEGEDPERKPFPRDRSRHFRDTRKRNAHARGTHDEDEPSEPSKEDKEKEEWKEEAEGATGDQVLKAKDSAFFMDSFQDTAAIAAIIAPGIRIPVFDKVAAPKKSFDSIVKLRLAALDGAYRDPDLKSFIDDQLGGKTYDSSTMSIGTARSLFRSVGALKKRSNSSAFSKDFGFTRPAAGGTGVKSKVRTPAELNKLHAEHFKGTAFHTD